MALLDANTQRGVVRAESGLQPQTYTQTYSTAARTVANPTSGAAAGATPTKAEHDALQADYVALLKVVTALIDDLQTLGLAA